MNKIINHRYSCLLRTRSKLPPVIVTKLNHSSTLGANFNNELSTYYSSTVCFY